MRNYVFAIGLTIVMLAMAMAVSRQRLRGQIVNPVTIFLSTWLISLITYLAALRAEVFDLAISATAQMLLLGSFSAFFLAALAVLVHKAKVKNRSIDLRESAAMLNSRRFHRVTDALLVLTSGSVLMKYIIIWRRYGNPLENLQQVRDDYVYGDLRFSVLLSLATIGLNLLILNLGVSHFFRSKRPWQLSGRLWLAILLVVLNDLATADRASIRVIIILVCVALYGRAIADRPVKLRHCVLAIMAVGLFIIGLSFIVYYRSSGDATLVEGVLVGSIIANVVGNIGSFVVFVDHPWPGRLFAHHCLGGVYQFLNSVGAAIFGKTFLVEDDYSHWNEHYYADIGVPVFNTTSYLTFLYSDFGVAGVVLVSFIAGWFCMRTFRRMIITRKVTDWQISAFLTAALVVSVRGFYPSAIGFWITLGALVVQRRMLSRRAGMRIRVAVPVKAGLGAAGGT
jgi:oligosaccharide repeat unit polymerase